MSADKRIELKTALIEREDDLILVRIKENAYISEEELEEQIQASLTLMGPEKTFGVLVDGTVLHNTTAEARAFMAKNSLPNRAAMAIVSNQLAIRMLANFFMRIDTPATPTKLFRTEAEAAAWLKKKIREFDVQRS